MNQAFEMVLVKIQQLSDSQEARAQDQLARLEQALRRSSIEQCSFLVDMKQHVHQDFDLKQTRDNLEDPLDEAGSQVSDANSPVALGGVVKRAASVSSRAEKEHDKKDKSILDNRSSGIDKERLKTQLITLDHPHFVKSWFQRVVLHPAFDITFGMLIMLNALSIGIETEYKTKQANSPRPFQFVSYTFAMLFLLELVLRLGANHFKRFFCGPERVWNQFDCGMAIFLLAILYVFSIILTMGATEYGLDGRYGAEVQEHYGTLARSMYTCFKAITGGVSWGDVTDPLMDVGSFYVTIFLVFVSFSILALLNIITSVFVDGTTAKSQNDRDMVVEKELQDRAATVANLRRVFLESDQDASGEISFEEFEAQMQDPKVEAYMAHLSVDTSNVRRLFEQLDDDQSGSIDIEEFMANLMNVNNAHTTEHMVQKVMNETKRVKKLLMGVADIMQGEVVRMGSSISTMGREIQQITGDIRRIRVNPGPHSESNRLLDLLDCNDIHCGSAPLVDV